MQVLFVIVAVSLCIATTALVVDAIVRVVLHVSFRRVAPARSVMPGRVEAFARPQGIWHSDRI